MVMLYDYVVIFILVYYSNHIIKSLIPTNRELLVNKNKKLNELRKKPIKTLEEQKEFLDSKFGNYKYKVKKKWTAKRVGMIIGYILIFIILFRFYLYLMETYNITFGLAGTVVFAIVFPLIMNYFLSKFSIETSDISHIIRWK